MTHPITRPEATMAFAAAGMIPALFNNETLTTIYYCLLIPPATFQLFMWLKTSIWPALKEWLTC